MLVDSGLFQGLKPLRLRNRESFPIDPATIDAVVVTHAHLDHIGYAPALVANGFRGPIFVTTRTTQLGEIVLDDSARLQEEEADYANRHGFSKHHPAVPLYTQADARQAVEQFRPVPFDVPIEVAPGVVAQFQRAGHILGSSGVLLEADGSPTRRVFVSGDVGRPDHPVLRAPVAPPAVDALLVESTYGDRHHEDADTAQDRLAKVITRTAERGGMVVIPAFAVDRTEIILLALKDLVRGSLIPSLPIYADSPMALAVLAVYRAAIAAGDADVRLEPSAGDPFDLGTLHEARTRDESIALNGLHVPSIIISASGMATGGRVVHHLARLLPDSRNTVVLAGYQAEGTRGRLLANHVQSVKMLGHYVPVRAEIEVIDAFSAHADADDLVAWLGEAPSPPDTAYVVHGEPGASAALSARIADTLRWNTAVPQHGERVLVHSLRGTTTFARHVTSTGSGRPPAVSNRRLPM